MLRMKTGLARSFESYEVVVFELFFCHLNISSCISSDCHCFSIANETTVTITNMIRIRGNGSPCAIPFSFKHDAVSNIQSAWPNGQTRASTIAYLNLIVA